MDLTTIGTIGLVLFAVLVGALLPVLNQLRLTLRTARKRIDRLGAEGERVLKDIDTVMTRVDALTVHLEAAGPAINQASHAVAQLSLTVEELRSRVETAAGMGATLVPAAMAAYQQWKEHKASAETTVRAAPPVPDAPPPRAGARRDSTPKPASMDERIRQPEPPAPAPPSA